ncbi:CHAT domain-containing protein [Tenacibaculum amylolyticum]|uniref:CHAT domain-containing protein n=1 Tax=Tenacibaculum amylolyticum TaxID=104269 RepID=UPI003894545B
MSLSIVNKKTIYILLVLFFSKKIRAQYSYEEIVFNSDTINFTEHKVDSILNSYKTNDTIQATIAHNFSFFFYRKKKKYDLAIKYGNREIKVLDSLKTYNNTYANALYNLGRFYHKKQDYKVAENYYRKVIETNVFPLKIGQSYCQIGDCFFKKGDYYKSIDFYLKGIPIIEKVAPSSTVIVMINKLANNCNKMDTKYATSLGIRYLKKADSIINTNPKKIKNTLKFSAYNNLANLYSLKHYYNFSKAQYYYKKNLVNALKENDSLTIGYTFLNLGELYLNKEKDSSLYFLNKSLQYASYGKTYIYETYKNLSQFFFQKKKNNEAIININKSIASCFKTEAILNFNSITESQIIKVKDKRSLLFALTLKCEILLSLYQKTKNQRYLKATIENVEFTNKVSKVIINFNSERKTNFLWLNEVSTIFNFGIYASQLINNNSKMFQFMEANKAFLLTRSITSNNEKLALPKLIYEKDIRYKKLIFENENNLKTSKDSLFNLKFRYQNFKDSIKDIYPKYFEKRNNIQPISLNELKLNLDSNTVILSYSLLENFNQKKLLGIAISKQQTYSFNSNVSEKELGLIRTYKQLISKPLKTKNQLEKFEEVSYQLYGLLFPNKDIKDLMLRKNLIIIPDNILQNLPFEALNSSNNSLQYLVLSNNISYAYSMSFLNFNKQLKRKQKTNFSGYAPISFNNRLRELKESKKELSSINHYINGDNYFNNSATKSNFFSTSINSKIIHLATHANMSNIPIIYFKNDSLKLNELYTYKNNADLVVLSACETNLGELKQGEGILNLARGFFYSGANSVISSLWKVNDASTSYLMSHFYKNIANNESKISALNSAKRTYLKEHSLSETSPYYWASFILIGDTTPVFKPLNFHSYLLLLILSFIIFIFFRKKWVTKI